MVQDAGTLEEQLTAVAQHFAPGAKIAGLRRLTGGASCETWSFDAVTDTGAGPLILRLAGALGESEGLVSLPSEAALIEEVAAAGVPVPRVHYVLEPEDGLGEGFIMQRVVGEALPQRILKSPEFAAARPKLARQCGEVLGRFHRVRTDRLPFLRTASAEQEVAQQFEQYLSHPDARRPVFELAFRWLKDNQPPPVTDRRLVHGDFRNGNFMVGPDGIEAVLDWEMAHLGDPLEDLGWICVNAWRYGNSELPVGGFGTREELFAGYEATSGMTVDPAVVEFWEVYGTLKWGIICQMMATSFRNSESRPLEPAVIGRRASEAEVDLMHILTSRE